jgi:hypothetical protein
MSKALGEPEKVPAEFGEPTDEEIDESFGDSLGRDIASGNALVVIARELRHIRIQLCNSLETSYCPKHPSRGVADLLADIAVAVGADCGCVEAVPAKVESKLS